MKTHTYDIFISYRREGGESAAQTIYDRLTETGYHVFLDRESLNSGDFDTRIYSVIDQCKDFLLILSPNALNQCRNADDWVRREVEYALEKNINIIPVMMKGFTFSEDIPLSMNPILSKNGVFLDYEFFDAFLTKLERFLKASPDFIHSLKKNRLVHKTLPFFIALLLVMAIGLIARQIYTHINSNYPFTAAEKNLTREYISYIAYNLSDLNYAAGVISTAYDECAYYYQNLDNANSHEVLSDLDSAIYKLTQVDTSVNELSSELKEKLADSPFDMADTIAMHDYVEIYTSAGINDLYFMKKVINGDITVSDYDAFRIVSIYSESNKQELLAAGYAANESLLDITNQEELANFKKEIVPILDKLTMQVTQWSDNKEDLVAAQNACYEKLQSLSTELASITGDMSLELYKEKEDYIEQMVALGMDREEAEEYVNRLLEKSDQETILLDQKEKLEQQIEKAKAEVRKKFAPSTDDDIEMLWGKMLRFLSVNMYDEALNCVDYIRETQRDVDIYSPEYTVACTSFIKSIGETGVDYGLMVVGYDSNNINSYYEIGDVIISYNGSVVHNMTEYEAAKEKRPEKGTVKVIVMRLDEEGIWKNVSLNLPIDSPSVYLASMTEKEYE